MSSFIRVPGLALVSLSLGLFALAATPSLAAASKEKEAAKYTEDLKTSKVTKVKVTALAELGKLGQIQKSLVLEATPYMIQALADKEAPVRAAAAKAVGMIDPDPKVVVPPLVKMLQEDKETSVRIAAAQGLGAMGSSAKEAVPPLRKIAKEEDAKSKLGRAAKDAIKGIVPRKN